MQSVAEQVGSCFSMPVERGSAGMKFDRDVSSIAFRGDLDMSVFSVQEKAFREIAGDIRKLNEIAYPYQKLEYISHSVYSIADLVKSGSHVRFFVVSRDREIVLIAPLRLPLGKGTAIVLGKNERYNMSDFLYNTSDCTLLSDAIFALLVYLKNELGRVSLTWWYLYEEALSWKAIRKLCEDGRVSLLGQPEKVNNVQIPLKNDYETYYQGLSKHARQNIRTAYNRIERNGEKLQVHFYPLYSGDKEILNSAREANKAYSEIELKRLKSRYQLKGIRFFVKKVRVKLFNLGWANMPFSMTLFADVSINDEVAAYAKCFLDLVHQKITVPNLAIDIKYGFYSPGIVLVNELVRYCQNIDGVSYLSMGRGEETYKYEMGGEPYITYKCEILLPSGTS